jgi:hypothetical protein
MPDYETLKSEEYKYGNNFIEIARKKVKAEQAEFISISKGFYTQTGEKRYKGGIGFPDDPKLGEFFVRCMTEFCVKAPHSEPSTE